LPGTLLFRFGVVDLVMPRPKASLVRTKEALKAQAKRRNRHTGDVPCRQSSGRLSAIKADRNIVLDALRSKAEPRNSDDEAYAEDAHDIAYVGEKVANTISRYF
jgi:hypothetical protein